MSEILNKQICLKLNARWVAVGHITIRDAVVFLASELNGQHPGFALDYQTVKDDNGEETLAYATPIPWEKWVTLEIREEDLVINSSRGPIRAPLVVVCSSYNGIPMRTPRASAGTIFARDKGVCQYTNRKLMRSEMSLDHIEPRSRGGRDTFLNLVTCDKKINTFKADRTPEEAGLRLIKQPKAPPTMAVVYTKDDAKVPSQRPFLI